MDVLGFTDNTMVLVLCFGAVFLSVVGVAGFFGAKDPIDRLSSVTGDGQKNANAAGFTVSNRRSSGYPSFVERILVPREKKAKSAIQGEASPRRLQILVRRDHLLFVSLCPCVIAFSACRGPFPHIGTEAGHLSAWGARCRNHGFRLLSAFSMALVQNAGPPAGRDRGLSGRPRHAACMC